MLVEQLRVVEVCRSKLRRPGFRTLPEGYPRMNCSPATIFYGGPVAGVVVAVDDLGVAPLVAEAADGLPDVVVLEDTAPGM